MGTPSTIAILHEDGTVEQVNAHYDGNIAHNGTILLAYYKEPHKIKELIKLGDFSGLAKEIYPPIGVEHSFKNPADEVIRFYGRDRGDKEGIKANKYASYEDYLAIGVQEPFNYLFDENKNKWFFLDPYEFKMDEKTMSTQIAKQPLAPLVKSFQDEMTPILAKYYEEYLKELKIEKEYKSLAKELSNKRNKKEIKTKKIKI
jgi:hypothetical protein